MFLLLLLTLLLALSLSLLQPLYAFAPSRPSAVPKSTAVLASAGRPAVSGRALDKEPLELCQENAEQVIEEVRRELGTIFGYDPASQAVGITGEIELVEVDGPTISVSLSGRFWHATDTVMLRVSSFVRTRIPEVIDVVLDMERSDIKDDNRLNTEAGGKKLF